MNIKPAIIVCAYNRPASLQRLLDSLAVATYPRADIPLVISIDQSPVSEVRDVSENFKWPYGEKRIIVHPEHLGLKEHILFCGGLSKDYEHIILFEDDLVASPYFYTYAVEACSFYKADKKIAGVSLYNYEVAESCFRPFIPADDGTDVYFMQVASSWGQAWSNTQWQAFTMWLQANPQLPANGLVPAYIQSWGRHSWKKHFIHYLVEQEKYFVFPRISLSTNFEEPGTNSITRGIFQTALQTTPCNYVFCELKNSLSVYDAWFEIKPEYLAKRQPALSAFEFTVDLFGAREKESVKTPYLLTSREAKQPLQGYANALNPAVNNVILGNKGSAITLAEVNDINFSVSQKGNLLEKNNPESVWGICAVIIMENNDVSELEQSLDSFFAQELPFKECLVIVPEKSYAAAEKLLSYKNDFCTLKTYGQKSEMEGIIETALQQSEFLIVTWLRAGTKLLPGALDRASNIFRNFGTINWIGGVEEPSNESKNLNKINTLQYRITPSSAYQKLENGLQIEDTELHFFRKHSFLNTLVKAGIYKPEHLFELLSVYQFHLTLNCFGIKKKEEFYKIDKGTYETLQKKYCNYEFKTRFSSWIIDKLLKAPFFNDGSRQWYLTSLKNYPDVLRYDEVNKTFFLCKF